MLSTASRSTVDAVNAALRLAPFVAMIAAWLFLAASAPATVTFAETCHAWVPTVTRTVPEDTARYYFFCGVGESASVDAIPKIPAPSPAIASMRAAANEHRVSVGAVLALDTSLSNAGTDVTVEALKRVERCEASGAESETAVADALGGCDPMGANLRTARESACGDAVTGIFWNNIAIMMLAFVIFYHALRGWLWELWEWVAMGDVVYGEDSPVRKFSGKGYGSGASPRDVESQMERLEGDVRGVKGDVKYVMGKVDEMVPLMRDLEAASRVNSPVGKGSPEEKLKQAAAALARR